MPHLKVVQGDCIDSIAAKHGLLPKTIWDHAHNAKLREKRRKNQSVLLPGDVVFVPKPRERLEDAATDKAHKFVLTRPRSLFQIRFEDVDGKPRKGVPYSLEIDGQKDEGKTGAEGEVKRQISPDARAGTLTLNPGKGADEEVYELDLGHLDPVDETSGLQARLDHLGFYSGKVDGDRGDLTRAALEEYQAAFDLPATGELDDATKAHLEQEYGS